MVEFLLLRGSAVWVIEAKSTVPPDEDIEKIREKFTNALMLTIAICLKRHSNIELPDSFKTLDLATANFKLVLVIKKIEKIEWLGQFQNILTKILRPTVKILALPPNAVVVLDETMARKHGLIA